MVGDDGLDGGSFVGVSIAAKVVRGRKPMATIGTQSVRNIFLGLKKSNGLAGIVDRVKAIGVQFDASLARVT